MPKYLRLALAVFTHSLVAAVSVFATLIYVSVPWPYYGCGKQERPLSRSKDGYLILMKEDVCGGFANSTQVTLELQMAGHHNSEPFFSFERNDSDPQVSWSSSNDLVIKLSDVGRISKKLDQVDGVRFNYEIDRQVR